VENTHKKGNQDNDKGKSKLQPKSTKGQNQETNPIVKQNEDKLEWWGHPHAVG
jgi:hypothetical protein